MQVDPAVAARVARTVQGRESWGTSPPAAGIDHRLFLRSDLLIGHHPCNFIGDAQNSI